MLAGVGTGVSAILVGLCFEAYLDPALTATLMNAFVLYR